MNAFHFLVFLFFESHFFKTLFMFLFIRFNKKYRMIIFLLSISNKCSIICWSKCGNLKYWKRRNNRVKKCPNLRNYLCHERVPHNVDFYFTGDESCILTMMSQGGLKFFLLKKINLFLFCFCKKKMCDINWRKSGLHGKSKQLISL